MDNKQERLLREARIFKLFNNDLGKIVLEDLIEDHFTSRTNDTNGFIMDEGRRRLIQYIKNIIDMRGRND